MTAEEAISYIDSGLWSASRPGLSRTRELLDRLGAPQKKLRFVHVAGTNGKGSTCAMLASVLREAGYRTGLYTSPYILSFNERMQVDGKSISDSELIRLTELIRPLADAMDDHVCMMSPEGPSVGGVSKDLRCISVLYVSPMLLVFLTAIGAAALF